MDAVDNHGLPEHFLEVCIPAFCSPLHPLGLALAIACHATHRVEQGDPEEDPGLTRPVKEEHEHILEGHCRITHTELRLDPCISVPAANHIIVEGCPIASLDVELANLVFPLVTISK